MDYGFIHEGCVHTPNGTSVSLEENEARNAAIEAAELAHWQSKPDRFIAYVSKSQVILRGDNMDRQGARPHR